MVAFMSPFLSPAQNQYEYQVNLNQVHNDRLTVSMKTPKVQTATAVFALPRIIPGTYNISDFGRFITNVKAFDQQGNSLPVNKIDTNRWKIGKASLLARITYEVEDIFDTKIKHKVYAMASTNIEEGKNFVFNNPGFFGHLEGYTKTPSSLIIEKPAHLYASTSLVPAHQTGTRDAFNFSNIDELYDSPIMYSVPDTSTIRVGNCEVLVSVYSPHKMIGAQQIAGWMNDLLKATSAYLGGSLPANRYAFLYYFKEAGLSQSFPEQAMGALEHPTASFYYLPEAKAEELREAIIDMSSHEFFHIITPLTIASEEIKSFNFAQPVLSKHLWLYEGTTEYVSHHVQVRYGLKSATEFLKELSSKITASRTRYNDTLAFTDLSKESAGRHASQYGNVYQKGALIAACLDIYLLHLSQGKYGLKDLTRDLSIRFGKTRAFNDETLFQEIGALTYPEIETFLRTYVAGGQPIPYDFFFGLAGIDFLPEATTSVVTLGGFGLDINEQGLVAIKDVQRLTTFGKKMGYRLGDIVYAINGATVTKDNIAAMIDRLKKSIKEGDPLTVKVGRKGSAGTLDTTLLEGILEKVTMVERNKLQPQAQPSTRQQLVQKAWLKPQPALASTAFLQPAHSSVESIDSLLASFYRVISGPAGPRNWDLFQSYFTVDGRMGSMRQLPNDQTAFDGISTDEYRWRCTPLFYKNGFYEEEIARKTNQFGQVAVIESTYQFRFEPHGPVIQRGINYFTLVRAYGRWWIQNIVWQGEDAANKLPIK